MATLDAQSVAWCGQDGLLAVDRLGAWQDEAEWTGQASFGDFPRLPNGVRLTAYSGGATDLPAQVLQDFLDAVAADMAQVPVGRVYRLQDIQQAHRDMEDGTVGGKAVVVL